MPPEQSSDPVEVRRSDGGQDRPPDGGTTGSSGAVETVAVARDDEPSIRRDALSDLQQGDRVFVNGTDVEFRVEDPVVGPNTLPAVYLECVESGATFVLEVRVCHDLTTGTTEERVLLVANEDGAEVTVGDAARYGEPVDRLVRQGT